MRAAGLNTVPGEKILAMAVLSILLTAPIGALGITFYGNKVLEIDDTKETTAMELRHKEIK